MGHLWGAGHDDPSNPQCLPPDPSTGRYIMHASSNTGYDNNNYRFSPCSIQAIFSVLYGLAEECFVDEQAALCGNGLVEPGEECDPVCLRARTLVSPRLDGVVANERALLLARLNGRFLGRSAFVWPRRRRRSLLFVGVSAACARSLLAEALRLAF